MDFSISSTRRDEAFLDIKIGLELLRKLWLNVREILGEVGLFY